MHSCSDAASRPSYAAHMCPERRTPLPPRCAALRCMQFEEFISVLRSQAPELAVAVEQAAVAARGDAADQHELAVSSVSSTGR